MFLQEIGRWDDLSSRSNMQAHLLKHQGSRLIEDPRASRKRVWWLDEDTEIFDRDFISQR